MRENCALHIDLGQYVVGNQPEPVPLCPGIRFGLRGAERGKPGRLRAHPPLANRAEGEAAAAGRRGAGFGEAAAEEEGESRPDCLGF